MERRRGRRDNGLDASDFAAVGDLDPRLAEHLLDLLGARGIAAYLQPSMDVNPITRNTTVPSRPTDRVFADRTHLSTAREFLRRLVAEEHTAAPEDLTPDGPEPSPAAAGDQPTAPEAGKKSASQQVDATFAGIVAGFDRPVDPTSAPWPAAENVSSGAPESPPAPPRDLDGPTDARHVTEDSLLDGLDTFGADLPEDDETSERFVPPPPPPLPKLSRQAVLGGLAILIGLVLLLAPGIGPFDRGDSIWLGFAAILGGAVALILRLRPGTDPDGDQRPDDGARV